MKSNSHPTKRFSDRVEYYARYRPGYPAKIIPFLQAEVGLRSEHVIADVGSGTGILSRLFLENGNDVYGVEPNADMRQAAEELLKQHERFHSVAATAEGMGLPEQSADFVTVGQAFHWFDHEAVRKEFARILRPRGFVIIVYNDWGVEGSELAAAYDRLLRQHGTDYKTVSRRRVVSAELLGKFFGEGGYQEHIVENPEFYDFESLSGRALSSSYAPLPGHPQHEALIADLRQLFNEFEEGGKVPFTYKTLLYWGRL